MALSACAHNMASSQSATAAPSGAMPIEETGDVDLYFTDTGTGEVLVFVPGIYVFF